MSALFQAGSKLLGEYMTYRSFVATEKEHSQKREKTLQQIRDKEAIVAALSQEGTNSSQVCLARASLTENNA